MKIDTRYQSDWNRILKGEKVFMEKDVKQMIKYGIGACVCTFILGFSIAAWALS